VIPPECLKGASWEQAYNKSDHEVKFGNGSLIRGFGATDGGSKLRGPQCHAAAGDELREWDKPPGMLQEAHTNMMFGVRLPYPDGTPARAVFGTTPKPIPYLLNLYRQPGVRVVTGSSYENLHNLSPAFRDQLLALEGTAIGRREIYAIDAEENEQAIFKRSWFRVWPHFDKSGNRRKFPPFQFVLISFDTAFKEQDFNAKKQSADFTACGVYGVFNVAQSFTEDERKKMGVRSKYGVILCDFWMERLGFPELLEKARSQYRMRWGDATPGGQAKRADVVLIEDKASGISLRQALGQYGVPCWPYNPGLESKAMRAHAVSPLVLQGMMFIPEADLDKYPDRKGQPRSWVQPMLEQICAYAGKGSVEHDDAVDQFTAALLYFQHNGFLEAKPMERQMPDPDEIAEQKERDAIRVHEAERRRGKSAYGA
jgi:phage terminase large subunit-like protein